MGALPEGKLRGLALLLALVLVATAATACGGGSATAPQPKASEERAPSTTSAAADAGAAAPKPGRPEIVAAEAMVEAMGKGDFTSALAHVDEKVRTTTLTEAALRDAWGNIVHDVGAYRGMEKVGATTGLGFTTVQVRCQGALAAFEVRVSFNAAEGGGGDGGAGGGEPVASAITIGHAWDPPAYADATKFHEDGAAVGEGAASLAASLVVPAGDGPFPGVVLLQDGASPDRDDTVGGTKVLRDLAWGLGARGVASVRFERRPPPPAPADAHAAKAAAHAHKHHEKTPSPADDVAAAIALLRKTSAVDPKRVIVLSRGDAAPTAALAAADDKKLAGVVIVAAPPPDAKTSAALRKATAPVIVLNAGHDGDVPEASAKRWARALAGRAHASTQTCATCNHWLADAAVERGRAANVAPAAVDAVAAAVGTFSAVK